MECLRRLKNYLIGKRGTTRVAVKIGYLFVLAARFKDYCLGEYYKSRLLHCGKGVGILKGATLFCPEMISIGDHSWIGQDAHLRGGGRIIIGAHCQIANNVIIASGNHRIDGNLHFDNDEYKDITLGNNVWIASNAIILPGVRIGDNSVVAAGAVVTTDVPENTVVAGVPARFMRAVPKKEA